MATPVRWPIRAVFPYLSYIPHMSRWSLYCRHYWRNIRTWYSITTLSSIHTATARTEPWLLTASDVRHLGWANERVSPSSFAPVGCHIAMQIRFVTAITITLWTFKTDSVFKGGVSCNNCSFFMSNGSKSWCWNRPKLSFQINKMAFWSCPLIHVSWWLFTLKRNHMPRK